MIKALHDSLKQFQYITIETHSFQRNTLWIFIIFRLSVLTFFPVSFLATRTTEGMFTLSFVDKCHLCLCFRLSSPVCSLNELGSRKPCCCSHRCSPVYLACCYEQRCTASGWLRALTTCSYLPAKHCVCVPEKNSQSKFQRDRLMPLYSF